MTLRRERVWEGNSVDHSGMGMAILQSMQRATCLFRVNHPTPFTQRGASVFYSPARQSRLIRHMRPVIE